MKSGVLAATAASRPLVRREAQRVPRARVPGRWLAWIEGTAPNGTPLRRALTFFGLPKDFLSGFVPDSHRIVSHASPARRRRRSWQEHQAELPRLAGDVLIRSADRQREGRDPDRRTGGVQAAGTAGAVRRIRGRSERRLSSGVEAQAAGIAAARPPAPAPASPRPAGHRPPRRLARRGRHEARRQGQDRRRLPGLGQGHRRAVRDAGRAARRDRHSRGFRPRQGRRTHRARLPLLGRLHHQDRHRRCCSASSWIRA